MLLNLPNILTLCNLLLGCAALIFLITGDWQSMLYCMLGAVLADFLDGFAARALKIKSALGKELDSIADMISFGLVPGAICYILILTGLQADPQLPPVFVWDWRAFPGFLLTAFSGLRLAKFNLDTRQSESFLGLPTPSATFFVLGLLMIARVNFMEFNTWLLQPWVIYAIVAMLSVLLISEIPMFSIKKLSWKGNEIQMIFVLVAIILMIWLRELSFAIIVALYIIASILMTFFRSTASTPTTE